MGTWFKGTFEGRGKNWSQAELDQPLYYGFPNAPRAAIKLCLSSLSLTDILFFFPNEKKLKTSLYCCFSNNMVWSSFALQKLSTGPEQAVEPKRRLEASTGRLWSLLLWR